MKPNMELRFYARGKGVALWRIAKRLGIHEQTLILHLRDPFTEEQAHDFKKIVDMLAEEEAR